MGGKKIRLSFKALTGESLTEMSASGSWTVGQTASKLSEMVPAPTGKAYRLILGVDPLAPADTLGSHIKEDEECVELIACPESEEESSDESSADNEKSKKRKENSKAKSKKDKKKDKKKKEKQVLGVFFFFRCCCGT